MIRIALAVAIGFMALPPHPLDDVLGNSKVSPKQAQQKILASKEFKAVVEMAVEDAGGEHAEIGPTYAQRVRLSIGNQLDPFPAERDDDEDDESEEAEQGDVAKALPPHPLDRDIKNGAKAADIIKAFAKSKAFGDVIKKAVENSQPLPKGAAGLTFGQSVRVKISENLLMKEDESESDEES